MNILHVLRHAKSSWDDTALPDHDRPLTPRGRRATARVAEHLRRQRVQPDLVLCSTARRAYETLEGIVGALNAKEIIVDQTLYGASVSELLARLRRVGGDVRSVMVIGHNPGLHDLVVTLAGDGDDDALLTVRRKFPTGALATLSFPGLAWDRLGPGAAYLETLVLPRELE